MLLLFSNPLIVPGSPIARDPADFWAPSSFCCGRNWQKLLLFAEFQTQVPLICCAYSTCINNTYGDVCACVCARLEQQGEFRGGSGELAKLALCRCCMEQVMLHMLQYNSADCLLFSCHCKVRSLSAFPSDLSSLWLFVCSSFGSATLGFGD